MQFSTRDCATLTDPSVRVVSEHKLLPAKPFKGDEIKLGPLECLVAPQIPVAVLYLYEAGGTDSPAVLPFETLKRAVEETLTFYPQLAGRLHVDEVSGDRAMRELQVGACMVEATCTFKLERFKRADGDRPELPQYRLLDLPAGGNAFFAPYSPDPRDVGVNPALSLQHTRFACGGVALGIRLLHTLADAAAFIQFVGDVASAYEQLNRDGGAGPVVLPPTGAEHPFAMDWNETTTDEAERARILRHHPLHMYTAGDVDCELAYKALHDEKQLPCPAPLPEVTVGRALCFTHEELQEMKNQYRVNSNGKVSNLTAFQALSAFLYTHVYRAKVSALRASATSETADQVAQPMPSTTFLLSINIRKLLAAQDEHHRMQGERYFGNGVHAPLTNLPVDVAASGNVGDVAAVVHAFLKEGFPSDDGAVMDMVRWVALQPNKAAVRTMFVLGGFMVSAWNHFNLYDGAVFGGARPVLVTTPFTPISLLDALAYYLPLNSKPGERGLIVYMALGSDAWERLERDPAVAPHMLR